MWNSVDLFQLLIPTYRQPFLPAVLIAKTVMAHLASSFMQREEDEWDDGLSFDGFGSDVEQLSTTGPDSTRDSNDYWFGKKCLGYLTATFLFSNSPHSRATENLDVSGYV